MHATSLFLTPTPNKNAQCRLLCFSHAGGNCNHFYTWQNELHPSVELTVCQLPGRGTRLLETPYTNMATLTEDMLSDIYPLLDKPLIFFGHSMGAKLAYELALCLQKNRLLRPSHVIISASDTPFHQRPQHTHIHHLPENDFVNAMARLGGTEPEVLHNRELMSLYLPGLRADYQLLETYYNPDREVVDSALTLLGAWDDNLIPYQRLVSWKQLFSSAVDIHQFEGGHFYIMKNKRLVIRYLNNLLFEHCQSCKQII